MSDEFKLPDIGEGLAEGEIVKWLVAVGDTVTEDQPLVEVMTDKATVEIPSPRAGTVVALSAAEGDIVKIGTTILVSNVITTANDFGLLSNVSAWLVAGSSGANYTAVLGQFGLLEHGNLEWFALSESFTRTFISSAFWQVSIAMLYLSWVAIWWARHSRQGLGQPLESGGRLTVKYRKKLKM